MKKYLFALFISTFFGYNIQANHVSKETAIKVAETFFKIQANNPKCTIVDVYTENIDHITTFYVFSFFPKGFVIVAADDNINPILGYSISSKFDKSNIPISLKSWLNQYSKYIYNVITLKQNSFSKIDKWEQLLSGKFQSTKSMVTPLCTTLWDQTCWYNELCPLDTLGTCGRAVTGCVATAIAQVMKFWNYPIQGQGTHSYNSQWHGVQSANFGATTYDWANMPDTLNSSNIAVATLMYHVGVSVDMNYYDNSSGSNLNYAINSLPNYFKYSNNIEFVNRNNYSDSTWIELMKYELNAGRPVLYQGWLDSIPAGHAWVCDGYDSNNFLHFNWGQMGNEGYYEIGNFIFNSSNQAVIKVMPIVSCDIAVRNFISPTPTTFSTPSTIKIKISNYDTLPVSNIPISYSVDGGMPINEIISSSIAALSDTIYEFIQPFDFSPNPGHIYNVKVYSSLVCDGYKDNDTLSISIENVACVNPPYSMGFEPSENINGWLVNDADNDNNTWSFGPGGNSEPTCAYLFNSLQADDWLISKCLQFETNKMYKLSFYCRTNLFSSTQKLNIFIGNQQNISSLTTLLASYNNITNVNYQQIEIYFTVPASGSYYIGWLANGTADNSIVLDDINISEQNSINIGLISTTLPVESCNLQQENVVVTVKNYCSTILNNIPISYSVNGGTPVNDTITTPINIGDSLVFTFSTSVDLSVNGTYNFVIYTSLTNDTINNNDTINITVTNHISITPVYTMGFEPSEDFSGWKIYNNNNDIYKWNIISNNGRTQPYCIRYDYSSWLPANDWFVSSCINLTSNQTYKLSFWYKCEASQWPEKLKVFIGNGQDTSSLFTQLLDLPNIVNTNYQYAETNNFTIPSNGLYYIGWYCYSDANMFNLYVDDILIDVLITGINNLQNTEFQIYPNPCKDEVTIEHSNISKEDIKYEIQNISGKQITQLISKNEKVKISINNFSTGIYILKITSSKGVIVKKLVKQ